MAQSGAQSLRLRRVSAIAAPAVARVPAYAVLAKCGDVVKYLEQNRGRFVQPGSSESDVEWAIQSGRLVLEFVEAEGGDANAR